MKLGRTRHLHFVGVGGTGMSGIARILLDLGYDVSGSDAKDSVALAMLRENGARIFVGHAAVNVQGADAVVRSTAVGDDNVEVVAARQAHVPVIHRADMLAELMRLKQGVAVAGAHGKTTTTSLVAHVLEAAGLDPTVIIGGKLKTLDAHGKLGRGELLVAEADESDGSFLKLRPVISVINNIDREHLDYWGTYDRLVEGIVQFANHVPFYGAVVLCQDDDKLAALRPAIARPVRTFGLDRPADVEGRVLETTPRGLVFRARVYGKDFGTFNLPLHGRHNVRNALAAIAVAHELDVGAEAIGRALATFPGIERRFEILCDASITVVDDYGHHPAELAATLQAARSRWDRPLWAVFQPHRYTRTEHLWSEFRTTLLTADHVRVTDIYAAGEPSLPGISGARLAAAVHDAGHADARYLPIDDVVAALRAEVPPGAVVLFLGAGSITQKARAYAAQLA